jgi:polyphosphate kinase
MAKKEKEKRDQRDAELQAPSAVAGQEAGGGPPPKMKRKEYEREMRVLHGELVALQEWVKASGARICVVFEGRDTAGKGGTIKRITERVSPRVFRVVALPAPTEREKSQMYIQRYMAHFPAAGEVVIFERVQPGRRRAGDGLLRAGGDRAVPRAGAGGREGHGRFGDLAAEVLAGGQRG